jgi:hypothetical protein
MKILVLMPLDEKWSFISTALFQNLSRNAKDKTFVMPMFSEWQMATKHMILGNDLPIHWNVATFGSILKAKEMYKIQNATKQDFILIGNISPDYKFDVIFNFQDMEKDEPYQDLYIEKLKEVFAEDKVLSSNLNFYDATASTMTLHNITAAAEFLSKYIETDPHIEDIKAKYKETLNFKEVANE